MKGYYSTFAADICHIFYRAFFVVKVCKNKRQFEIIVHINIYPQYNFI